MTTFTGFLAVLRARRASALLVLALTLGLTLAVSLLLPKRYLAVASVVLDFRPDPLSAALYGGLPSPAMMATQTDIIESDRVALRVVRNLRLDENPQVRRQWLEETQGRGSIETWLGALFRKNMDVVPSRESNVISVSYRAPDPRFAAALANAFVQAYIDTSIELRVDPARRYSAFFDSRAKDAREALERAQSRLSGYQNDKGIVASDERLDVESARLSELSSQLTALQALASESGSRQVQAQGPQGDRMQEVLGNPLLAQLKADVGRAEARLKELGARYGDNHPQVVEARASLGELRTRAEAETAKLTGGVTVANRINRQREAELRASLDAQRTRVLRMKAVRDEGNVLMRDVENAQRTYDAILQRLTQTQLESQTTQSNVNVLSEAVPPLEPASPRLLPNLLLAGVAGSLLAAATAAWLELRDRRVRSVDDLAAALGLPVLAVLPARERARRSGAPATGGARSMRARLLAPLRATAAEERIGGRQGPARPADAAAP